MDTIANIISSVPEPLATAILTATITGIVIFILQKRIENSFAEKLETFRTIPAPIWRHPSARNNFASVGRPPPPNRM